MSLDREIEDLLAVDPSPDFAARVRQRIAAEPAPAAGWLSWGLVATAATCAAAIVLAGLLWNMAPVAPTQQANAPAAERRIAPAREPQTAPVAERAIAAADTPARQPPMARANGMPRPVVLIQREEAAAMNLLLARVQEGALPDMTQVLAVVDATGPRWIEIPALVIKPIATGEGE